MATIQELDSSSLVIARRLLWQAGDDKGAADITQELLKRVAMGHIIQEYTLCEIMNRHRPMSYGKERRWHEGRVAKGKMKKAVEKVRMAYYTEA